MHTAVNPLRLFPRLAISLCVMWVFCSPALSSAGGIAVLTRDDIVPYDVFVKAFVASAEKNSMRAADVRIFSVYGLSDSEQQRVIDQIADFKPSLLLAVGSGALGFARTYFSRLPCVCVMVVNPALLQSFEGTNASCLRMEVSPHAKLSTLKQILPNARRVGVVYDPQQCADQVQVLQESASRLGLTVELRPVSSTREAIHAFETVIEQVDALVMFYDRTVLAPQSLQHMYALSFRHKIPVIGLSEKYVRLGALFALDVDIEDLGRAAGEWARRCKADIGSCAGVHYSDARWRLYVNTTVAPKMNITIPEHVLKTAVVVE